MSTSYDSLLIVGVPMSELYKPSVQKGQKTKYDPDTGKPSQVEIKMLHATFGNKTLPPVAQREKERSWSQDEFYQDFDFLDALDLKVYLPSPEGYTSPEYVAEHGIVGISLACGDNSKNGIVAVVQVTTAIDKVKKALEQFGFTDEPFVCSQLTWG